MGQSILKRIICGITLAAFVLTSVKPTFAQAITLMPAPGSMVALSGPLNPPLLKGIRVYPDNPFKMEFILDKGDAPLTPTGGHATPPADQGVRGSVSPSTLPTSQPMNVKAPQVSTTSTTTDAVRLIKYFLASLTVPEKDLWVNLSPYEQDRIVSNAFGQTEMGRDLLAQDYLLKQITASVIYPESETGKAFWAKVYQASYAKFGTSDIPFDTFNKVWIMPEKAVVYENATAATAYIVESKLKVMLEMDYLALTRHSEGRRSEESQNDISKQVLRSIIIPILEKEVNEGANFAPLRQVYQSLILAMWYKKKIKSSLLSKAYVDRNKVEGVNISDPNEAEKIWGQYVEAFKKGAYNYIKEEKEQFSDDLIPRKYFSGGVLFSAVPVEEAIGLDWVSKQNSAAQSVLAVKLDPAMSPQERWAEFSKPTADKRLWGTMEELSGSRQFLMAGLYNEQYGFFQHSFHFPGEGEKLDKLRRVGLGQNVKDMKCVAIRYDQRGDAVAFRFKGENPAKGTVLVEWSVINGKWNEYKLDKVYFWELFTQPTWDQSKWGKAIELKGEQQFSMEGLYYEPGGTFYKVLFPGENEEELSRADSLGRKLTRAHTLGMKVAKIHCDMIRYGVNGQPVAFRFSGDHPLEGNVSAEWSERDGVWTGKRIDRFYAWKVFTDLTKDQTKAGKYIKLEKDQQYSMEGLYNEENGSFKQSFRFPGEETSVTRGDGLGVRVKAIYCVAIRYDQQGNAVAFMFEGLHPTEGRISVEWRVEKGEWKSQKVDRGYFWNQFVQPTQDKSKWGKRVELAKDDQFDMTGLYNENSGDFYKLAYLPGEEVGSPRRRGIMPDVINLRCVAIEYDLKGSPVVFRFDGDHLINGKVWAEWRMINGVWERAENYGKRVIDYGVRKRHVSEPVYAWEQFTQSAPDQSKWGKLIELENEQLFSMEGLYQEEGSQFNAALRFPGEANSQARSLRLGMSITKLYCVAIRYDQTGNAIAFIFSGMHAQNGKVSAEWSNVNGTWEGRLLDKAAEWENFARPAKDKSKWGQRVELKDEQRFSMDGLYQEQKGVFQIAFRFPGEESGFIRGVGLGVNVKNIHCVAIGYDLKGHAVAFRFEGLHPDKGEVLVEWRLHNGKWEVEKFDQFYYWEQFTRSSTDRSKWGKTIELKNEQRFLMDGLYNEEYGYFQQSFRFPGEEVVSIRPIGLRRNVKNIQCVAIRYDQQGNAIAFIFEGIHSQNGSVLVEWSLNNGEWIGKEIDKAYSWDQFTQPTNDRSKWGKTIELKGDQRFSMEGLYNEEKGFIQRTMRFPGEEDNKQRSIGLGGNVKSFQCVAIRYDQEGNPVMFRFTGEKDGATVDIDWIRAFDGVWRSERHDGYVDGLISGDVNIAKAVEALGDHPDALMAYLLTTTKLSPSVVRQITRQAFKGLANKRGLWVDITDFKLEQNVFFSIKAPERTDQLFVVVSGRVRPQFLKDGFQEIHVSGSRERVISVYPDGKFKASFHLKKSEILELEMALFDRKEERKGSSYSVVIEQTSDPDDSIEKLVELLNGLSDEMMGEIVKDKVRLALISRRIERGILGQFTESEAAGFADLDERIAKAGNVHVKKIFEDIRTKFRMIARIGQKGSKFEGLVPGERLYFYQKYAIFLLEEAVKKGNKGMILALEQGLGKTLVALALGRMSEQGAVIITPNSVVSSWGEMYGHFFGDGRLALVTGSGKEKMEAMLEHADKLRVVNREYLQKKTTDERFRAMNRKGQWVLIDESQFLSSSKSLQSQGALALEGDFRLLISATPITKPEASRAVLYYLTRDKAFSNVKAFSEWMKAQEADGYRKLHFLLDQFLVRIKKEDVFKRFDPAVPLSQQKDRLPAKRTIKPSEIGRFELSTAQCDSILKLFVDWERWQKEKWKMTKEKSAVDTEDDRERRTPDSLFARKHALRQIMDDPMYIGVRQESSKHAQMDVIVKKEVEKQNGKVVIFAQYKHQVRAYAERYAKYGAVTYYGDTMMDRVSTDGYLVGDNGRVLKFKKKNNFEFAWDAKNHLIPDDGGSPISALDYSRLKFQNDPDTKVIIASYKSGAVGVTFTAADAVIFDDLADDYVTQYQAEDRANRIDNARKRYETHYYSLQAQYPAVFLERMKGLAVVLNKSKLKATVVPEKDISGGMREDPNLKIDNVYERFFEQGTFDEVLSGNLKRQERLFRLVIDGVVEENDLERDEMRPFTISPTSKLDETDAESDSAMSEVVKPTTDAAILPKQEGGIDLTNSEAALQTQSVGGEVKFDFDPAQVEQMQNAAGVSPVIINIQPMTDLELFLGMKGANAMRSGSS
ncbi:MAG: hypothetical protein HQL22_08730 [Candidatus Omnitrophica bacterium]|nr:hypothetical protein [Candidatus Omnitrophota bacterium]